MQETALATPPRAWGRLRHQTTSLYAMRNTPTSVGKTGRSLAWTPKKWKHPHERGEDNASLRVKVASLETPPRAWGRPAPAAPPAKPCRNTPTSVGKTSLCRISGTRPWKHPHERGEDARRLKPQHISEETPPRAWGRPVGRGGRAVPGGNTPTSVGKTWSAPACRPGARKHPHERGEDPSDR